MDLEHAIQQVARIDAVVKRAMFFRGYRSGMVMLSAFSGLIGAMLQPVFVGNAIVRQTAFVDYWCFIALCNICFVGICLWMRCVANRNERRLTLAAVGAIAPSLVSGALLTFAISTSFEEAIVLLPGLWSILFGLGVCASRSVLPGRVLWAGSYFIATGTIVATFGDAALNPLSMIMTFGIGQGLSSLILYWSLEHNDASNLRGAK